MAIFVEDMVSLLPTNLFIFESKDIRSSKVTLTQMDTFYQQLSRGCLMKTTRYDSEDELIIKAFMRSTEVSDSESRSS